MPSDQGRSYQRERELIEAANLDAAIRMFINRWAPEDGPRDFEADLIHIIQRVYRDAQAPFVSGYTAAMMTRPVPPIVMEADSHRQR